MLICGQNVRIGKTVRGPLANADRLSPAAAIASLGKTSYHSTHGSAQHGADRDIEAHEQGPDRRAPRDS